MRTLNLAIILVFFSSSSIALEPRIKVTASDDDRPVISGVTNLPDNTKLIIELSRNQSNYSAQGKAKVVAGKFQVGPFSQYGSPLNPGTYVIEVTMPVPMVQSAEVKALTGPKGENLRGKLVKKSILGENMVEYRTTIKISDGKTNSKADADARLQAEDNRRVWLLQACKDICKISKESAKAREENVSSKICYESCITEAISEDK